MSDPVTGHPDNGLTIDENGWLFGPNVERIESVRCNAMTTADKCPLGLVWHFTATDWGTAYSLAKRIATYRRGIDRAASWTVLVTHDGKLLQSVSCRSGAWHCAKGELRDAAGTVHRINRCTVGIELEGHGKEFPDAQRLAALALLDELVETYGMSGENARLEHSTFDPKRRSDPGPVWRAILQEHGSD